MIILFK